MIEVPYNAPWRVPYKAAQAYKTLGCSAKIAITWSNAGCLRRTKQGETWIPTIGTVPVLVDSVAGKLWLWVDHHATKHGLLQPEHCLPAGFVAPLYFMFVGSREGTFLVGAFWGTPVLFINSSAASVPMDSFDWLMVS